MKRELEVANKLRAVAYVVHGHDCFHLDRIKQFISKHKHLTRHTVIAVENTSRIVKEPAAYKKKLLQFDLVLDTAHLYSSGLCANTHQMIDYMEKASANGKLVGLHLND
jgi:endonuclease IV